jgi:hypothetical protein
VGPAELFGLLALFGGPILLPGAFGLWLYFRFEAYWFRTKTVLASVLAIPISVGAIAALMVGFPYGLSNGAARVCFQIGCIAVLVGGGVALGVLTAFLCHRLKWIGGLLALTLVAVAVVVSAVFSIGILLRLGGVH